MFKRLFYRWSQRRFESATLSSPPYHLRGGWFVSVMCNSFLLLCTFQLYRSLNMKITHFYMQTTHVLFGDNKQLNMFASFIIIKKKIREKSDLEFFGTFSSLLLSAFLFQLYFHLFWVNNMKMLCFWLWTFVVVWHFIILQYTNWWSVQVKCALSMLHVKKKNISSDFYPAKNWGRIIVRFPHKMSIHIWIKKILLKN